MRSDMRPTGAKRLRKCAWLAAASAATLSLGAGCPDNEDAALQAFRDTAAQGLRAGLTAISAGLINGFFDAFEADGGNSNTNTNTNVNANDNTGGSGA